MEAGFGISRNQAFVTTAEERGQVIPGHVLPRLAAGDHHRPVGKDRLQAQDPSARDAILRRVRTSGVLGDVPAYRGRGARTRIGRVVEAAGQGGLLECLRDHPALDHGDAVRLVDLEDPAHPVEGEGEPTVDRDRARREAGPPPLRGDGDPAAAAIGQDRRHLGGRPGADDRRREGDVPFRLVVGVGLHLFPADEEARADDRREGGDLLGLELPPGGAGGDHRNLSTRQEFS